jgi:hypothetical protein
MPTLAHKSEMAKTLMALMMKAAHASETSVNSYETKRRNNSPP